MMARVCCAVIGERRESNLGQCGSGHHGWLESNGFQVLPGVFRTGARFESGFVLHPSGPQRAEVLAECRDPVARTLAGMVGRGEMGTGVCRLMLI
ncbi:hypothetical protein [Burkholderia sp. Ac-20392]|uniref:hypothetical protein n=1 Tax=Burkholderia sp. Ac-20392 TaxID=2703905 RepID=UPI00198154AE|nr:hypothetical protein [Burkholderia sp. Ac-20392]MBN3795066.1 hypothetical protein [Burkholderia sp. Ac-20392]